MNRGLSQGSVTYLHGGNFYDGHDGGNAPGNLVMESIGQLSRAMSKIVENVHPSVFVEYANRQDVDQGAEVDIDDLPELTSGTGQELLAVQSADGTKAYKMKIQNV